MEVTRQDLDSTRQQLDSAIQVRRKQWQYDDDDDVTSEPPISQFLFPNHFMISYFAGVSQEFCVRH